MITIMLKSKKEYSLSAKDIKSISKKDNHCALIILQDDKILEAYLKDNSDYYLLINKIRLEDNNGRN
jgi:hypothetical protein